MNLGATRFRDLGPIATEGLRSRIDALPDAAWTENPVRQQSYFVHRQTRSIVFLFSDDARWPRVRVDHGPRFEDFRDAVMPIFSTAARRLSIGARVIKAMLAALPPGAKIEPHYDRHAVFAAARRLHVPLITNDRVRFRVARQDIRLEPDHLYEINNRRVHEVHNGGDEDRIHLIFDLLPMEDRT